MGFSVLPKFPREDVFGFAGTISRDRDLAERLWDAACIEVADFFRESDPQIIENFLRSTYGRHFADQICHESYPQFDETHMVANIRKALNHFKFTRRGKMVRTWRRPFDSIRKATKEGSYVE